MRALRAAALAVVAVLVVGCSGASLPGSLGGPVIVEGVFLDRTGQPVPDTEVTLSVSDWAQDLQPGDVIPTIYELRTTTDSAGRFVFRGPPSPELTAYVDGHGTIDFDVRGLVPGTGEFAGAAFSRILDGSVWVDAPSPIELQVPTL